MEQKKDAASSALDTLAALSMAYSSSVESTRALASAYAGSDDDSPPSPAADAPAATRAAAPGNERELVAAKPPVTAPTSPRPAAVPPSPELRPGPLSPLSPTVASSAAVLALAAIARSRVPPAAAAGKQQKKEAKKENPRAVHPCSFCDK